MVRNFVAALALASVTGTAALAADPVELNDANADRIRGMLSEQGYEVGKIKIEDGLYEAYARKDGQRFEIFMDGAFDVVRTEVDD